jgi:hypothetical protein
MAEEGAPKKSSRGSCCFGGSDSDHPLTDGER